MSQVTALFASFQSTLRPGSIFIIPFLTASSLVAQSACGDVQLQLTPDYSFAIGSSSGGSAYSFALGGQTPAQGPITQLALFRYDTSLASTSGIVPSQAVGTSLVPGKFGSAVAIAAGGILSYPEAGNLSFGDGTIEMWISPQYDGANSVYTQDPQVPFQYSWGSGGNQLVLAVANDSSTGAPSGYLFAGASGVYAGYLAVSGIAEWKAGEWHHVALTYSTAQSRLRLYIDGVLAAEGDAAIQFPTSGSGSFTIGGDSFGHASAFTIDEVRISNDEKPAPIIAYDAGRTSPFANDEVYLSLAGVSPGQLTYTVSGCGAASYTYTGIPITNVNPPSNLLAPGSTSLTLSFNTLHPSSCGYSVGSLLPFSSMQAISNGQKTTTHQGTIAGISSSPLVLNKVYLQCDSNPDFVEALQYRAVAALNPPFPRIGNIWWGSYLFSTNPDLAAQTSLFLGPDFTTSQVEALRALNPSILALPSLGATYTPPPSVAVTPDSYLMKDIHGNPIVIWLSTPLTYLLNLTKPEVAAWAANNLFQQLRQSNLAFDGLFLDSVSTSISGLQYDAYGNPVQISSSNNGIADDPTALDAAWKAGVLLEIDTLRQLAPYAYLSCHCNLESDLVSRFNGASLVFLSTDAREGRIPFSTFWDTYNSWSAGAVPPVIVNVEGSPPNQLDYGYGQPIHNMPPGVAEFGQTFYPNMRFALATTLMNNGFFSYDFGDAGYAVAWWYDEYGFPLGYPLGPAATISSGAVSSSQNLLVNGGFENGLTNWSFNLTNDGQVQATVALDSTIAAEGNNSAHIDVVSAGTAVWHVDLEQDGVSLVAGTSYQLQFWARADQPRTITVNSQGGAPNWPNYGLNAQIAIDTSWGLYSASFIAPTTATDGRIQFWVGDVAGNVWIDGVQLLQALPVVYRRDFTLGVALLNATTSQQTISLGSGLQRFTGSQAPKYQYIVDDADTGFTSTGSWNAVTYDSGVIWDDGSPTSSAEALGPYYHAWQLTAHQLDATSGTAQWSLNIPEDGQYTIQVWLPAAPNAGSWTKNAVYEIVSGGNVVASTTIDQTTASAGDGWHMIATLNLTAAGAPFLRVHNGGSGSLIADAVYVTSAALYNDGSPASQVTLAPMDGILLQRQQPVSASTSVVSSVVNAASYQSGIASAGFVSIFGTGLSASTRAWTWADFTGSNLPLSLDRVSVTINGKPAYVEYISPTQINAIAPDDDTIGPVPVQVKTPQGTGYAGTALKQKLSPAFFVYQSGTTSYVAAVHLDGTLVGPTGPSSRPAVPGEFIEMYGTGFGATNPAVPTAQLVPQPAPLVLPATVSIGGVNAVVQWAGLVSSGLYQINVQIPNVAPGDQPVQTAISGFQGPGNVFVTVGSQ
ncbi:MAG: LamG-like jellyroll fold domain-containing protein [Bryobacteraceae bacterium]